MENTKNLHTPGPWRLFEHDQTAIETFDGVQVAKATYVPTMTQLQKTKVESAWYVGNGMTAMANAALIAKAPTLLNENQELKTDSAELLVALEMITDELRGHSNDNRGQKMIAESLKVQDAFRKKYNVVAPSER